jgi:CheY-like chemotaxis protein
MSINAGNQDSLSIAIVDDKPLTVKKFGKRLEKVFSHVITGEITIVETQAKAIQLRQDKSGIMLYLVDLRQPDASGVDSEDVGLQQIKELSQHPQTWVIAFSGSYNDDDQILDKVRACGGSAYIPKDFALKDLHEKLGAFLTQMRDLPNRPAGLGTIELIDPTWARHLREEKEWLGIPENLDTYAGKVVALFNGKVWGSGTDQLSTLRAVRAEVARLVGEPGLPAPYELMYLVIPDWKSNKDQGVVM